MSDVKSFIQREKIGVNIFQLFHDGVPYHIEK